MALDFSKKFIILYLKNFLLNNYVSPKKYRFTFS